MQKIEKLVFGCFLGFSLLVMGACENQPLEDNRLFLLIFKNDTSVFRGLEPGDPTALVLDQEFPNLPVFSDEIGISYEDTLIDGQTLVIDYLIDNLKQDKPRGKVVSIVANIFMNNEVETANLYGQITKYFNGSYGISSGIYGDYSWDGITKKSTPMQVHLKMADNKKGLTINFVDTEPYREDNQESINLTD